MNVSRLLIATACSMAVAGAAGVAFAQTTTPATPATPSSTTPNQSQTQGQTPSTTTAPANTTPGNMNSTTPRPAEATTPSTGTTGTPSTTGTAATRSPDGSMRTPADRATDEHGTRRTRRPQLRSSKAAAGSESKDSLPAAFQRLRKPPLSPNTLPLGAGPVVALLAVKPFGAAFDIPKTSSIGLSSGSTYTIALRVAKIGWMKFS